MPKTAAIIPARYASTRLPGKPLLSETGQAMILHVIENTLRVKSLDQVMVATDDPRIHDCVTEAGYEAVMTRVDHPNGTSRLAEAAKYLDPEADLIINVQGDEPELDPSIIEDLVTRMREGGEEMGTVASYFGATEEPRNPNIVKVVLNEAGQAMYFSRALIPHDRDATGNRPLKHLGIYAYQRDFLKMYVSWPPGALEQLEKLEQLRVLERGYPIAVIVRESLHPGIDTPEQYQSFVDRYQRSH